MHKRSMIRKIIRNFLMYIHVGYERRCVMFVKKVGKNPKTKKTLRFKWDSWVEYKLRRMWKNL